MLDRLAKITSTFFYIGYLPAAPGSIASIAGGVLYLFLRHNIPLYLVAFAVVTVLGFALSGRMERISKKKDPGCVVIDEVSGILLTYFLLPATPAVLVTGFFVFRAFDMFKIYPVNKFEKISGGAGIMLDDIFAGIYANLAMHAALWLARIFSA